MEHPGSAGSTSTFLRALDQQEVVGALAFDLHLRHYTPEQSRTPEVEKLVSSLPACPGSPLGAFCSVSMGEVALPGRELGLLARVSLHRWELSWLATGWAMGVTTQDRQNNAPTCWGWVVFICVQDIWNGYFMLRCRRLNAMSRRRNEQSEVND